MGRFESLVRAECDRASQRVRRLEAEQRRAQRRADALAALVEDAKAAEVEWQQRRDDLGQQGRG